MIEHSHITALRNALAREEVQGFLLPVNDPYLSEYPPACYRRLQWLTGFTGSAGLAVILPDRAALFVDGRYTLQAAQQVDGALYEVHNSADLSVSTWLKRHAPPGTVIGYDAWLHTVTAIRKLEKELADGVVWQPLEINPVDALWSGRPAIPTEDVFVHPKRFSGKAPGSKRKSIAQSLRERGVEAVFIASPDSLCWLLDIRGDDVPNTPLVLATALLHADGRCDLMMPERQLKEEVTRHLGAEVRVHSPQALEALLKQCEGNTVLMDLAATPMACYAAAQRAGVKIIEGQDPCLLPRACKNSVEMEGIRAAHIRDGAAVTSFLCWLNWTVAKGATINELEAEQKLLECRKHQEGFCGPSFETIAGAGANGAIVHYRATEASSRQLESGSLFLLDSGGQYPDGTTDITRTVAIGMPSGEMRDRFTRVLKGHIAIATAVFPAGTCGSQLDALARYSLWQAGLDYDHGTGHGVGQYLGVHEGPQRISKRGGDVELMPGMILSNEPGYYKTGQYGIRIENLVVVREINEPQHEKPFLAFETLTCAPIDTQLIEKSLLTETEVLWLNHYHAWVEKTLLPLLGNDEQGWLKQACRAI